MYPVGFFDALRVKIKEDSVVRNKRYLAFGRLMGVPYLLPVLTITIELHRTPESDTVDLRAVA